MFFPAWREFVDTIFRLKNVILRCYNIKEFKLSWVSYFIFATSEYKKYEKWYISAGLLQHIYIMHIVITTEWRHNIISIFYLINDYTSEIKINILCMISRLMTNIDIFYFKFKLIIQYVLNYLNYIIHGWLLNNTNIIIYNED